jgi:hypothetical protein
MVVCRPYLKRNRLTLNLLFLLAGPPAFGEGAARALSVVDLVAIIAWSDRSLRANPATFARAVLNRMAAPSAASLFEIRVFRYLVSLNMIFSALVYCVSHKVL